MSSLALPIASRTNRRRLALIGAAVLVIFLWPVSYLASPRWDVQVVDENGKPRTGANVRLVYQNYSVEGNSHEITLQADDHGQVSFPPQYLRATLIQRMLFAASSATAGVHASFGRHAHVFAFGDSYEGEAVQDNYVVDWRGGPESMNSKIVAKSK
jgi:hypothetical protein